MTTADIDRGLADAAKVTVFATAAERELDEAMDVPAAAAFLGVPEESLTALVERGDVPVGRDGLGYHDVAALGLNCGLGTSVAEHGLMMMMRFARQEPSALLAELRWSFRIHVTDDAAGELSVRTPHEGAAFESIAADGHTLTGRLRTRGVPTAPYVSALVSDLYGDWLDRLDSGRTRFQWVSAEGRRHPLLRVEEGRADCVCIAAVAAQELQRGGLATRLESGRVLGLLDAQHVWASVLDEDGVWKRFDPLLEAHCRRLWGADTPYGAIFRGPTTNAMPGWPGTGPIVTAAGAGVAHSFTAQRERS